MRAARATDSWRLNRGRRWVAKHGQSKRSHGGRGGEACKPLYHNPLSTRPALATLYARGQKEGISSPGTLQKGAIQRAKRNCGGDFAPTDQSPDFCLDPSYMP